MSGSTRAAVPELDDLQVVITRVINAPRELVFKAWTDPVQLVRWYAPQGCSIEFRQIDIRQGGTFHSCIRTPQGFQCWCVGEYQEVVPPERLVFTMAIADEQGERITPAVAGHDQDWPAETTVIVTFTPLGSQTKLTLQQSVSEALARRTGAYPSWLQMLDHLAAELAAATAGEQSMMT